MVYDYIILILNYYIWYIYIYIYIYNLSKFTLHWFHIHIIFPAAFVWSLSLAETAYPIVNMFQVMNKEARAT